MFHLHRCIQEGTLPNVLFLFSATVHIKNMFLHLLACKILTSSFALPHSMRKRTQGNMDRPLRINNQSNVSIVSQPAARYSDLRRQTGTPNRTSMCVCESNKNFTQLLNQKLKKTNKLSRHHHTSSKSWNAFTLRELNY